MNKEHFIRNNKQNYRYVTMFKIIITKVRNLKKFPCSIFRAKYCLEQNQRSAERCSGSGINEFKPGLKTVQVKPRY